MRIESGADPRRLRDEGPPKPGADGQGPRGRDLARCRDAELVHGKMASCTRGQDFFEHRTEAGSSPMRR